MTLGQILTWRPLWFILGIAGVTAGWFLIPVWGEDTPPDQQSSGEPQIVFVKTIKAKEQSDFTLPVWYSGTVRARRKTQVAFQRSGKLDEILFDEGDFVDAKQPIAKLDSRQVDARMKQLTAQMLAARARRDELKKGPRIQAIRTAQANVRDFQQQFANAELDLQRAQKLLAKNAVSRQEYDQAKYRVETLQARIDAASAQLDELNVGTRIEQVDAAEASLQGAQAAAEIAEHDLDDCTLTAPFRGTITRRMADEGAVLDAGVPVFELVESNHLEFAVGLPIEFARQLNVETPVEIEIDGVEIKANLKNKVLALDPLTRTQTVIFKLDSSASEKGIVDQQMGRIRFERLIGRSGFVLPTTAIVNDQQGLWNCFTLENNSNQWIAKRQSIEVLHFQGDFVFVRGTLSEGDQIVAEGLQRLTNGQAVQPTDPQGAGQ